MFIPKKYVLQFQFYESYDRAPNDNQFIDTFTNNYDEAIYSIAESKKPNKAPTEKKLKKT